MRYIGDLIRPEFSRRLFCFLAALLLLPAIAIAQSPVPIDPLPAWNEGPVKESLLDFVKRTTDPSASDYIPPEERIATFDNDGTLWCEKPEYVQAVFIIDRIKALAPAHPEWSSRKPFAEILLGDLEAVVAGGERAIVELITATHAHMTTEEFHRIVTDWLETTKHPRFHQPYTRCVYQPMLELLAFLRANQFKTYIVSGGGVDFMRPWTQQVYGIPPEQVIGSMNKIEYRFRDGQAELFRLPEIAFIDDHAGKPVGIHQVIGRRPVFAFGNSDGDQQMLEWTAAGPGLRFMGLVHHTDAEREYAYDRHSHVGRLDKAWDEAVARGWTITDMKRDWKVIFAFEQTR